MDEIRIVVGGQLEFIARLEGEDAAKTHRTRVQDCPALSGRLQRDRSPLSVRPTCVASKMGGSQATDSSPSSRGGIKNTGA
jgi:hypothetical protein